MRKARTILGLIVSTMVLGWLARQTNLETLIAQRSNLSLDWVMLAAAATAAMVLLEAGRMWLAANDLCASFGALVRMQLIAALFRNFGLGQAGGDVYQVIRLRAFTLHYRDAMARVLLVRVVGLACVALIGLWGLIAMKAHWQTYLPDLPDWLLIGSLTAVIALGVLTTLWMFARQFLKRQLTALRSAFQPRRVGQVFCASVLITMLRCLQFWLVLQAVGVIVPLPVLAAVVSIAMFANSLPISYGGWGVREGAIVWLLVQASVSYEQALLAAALGRVLMVLLAAVGAGALWHEKVRSQTEHPPQGSVAGP